VGRIERMNKRSFAIAALAVAGVILSAGMVVSADYDDEQMTGAGGGGWWKNVGEKNTFGFYLNASDITMSEFVLQARDVGVTVHAYQFDNIVFNYDAVLGTGSAEAWGMAYVAGVEASFHLIVEDNGHRSVDRLMLELSGDYTGMWEITGLGGGQIWVYME
jgi:hypothetical protein